MHLMEKLLLVQDFIIIIIIWNATLGKKEKKIFPFDTHLTRRGSVQK